MNLSQRRFVISILILYLFEQVETWNKFCSVICANQQCNTANYADCKACILPWTWNTTTNVCQLLPTTGWAVVDISTDVGGSISPDFTTTGTCGPCTSGCSGGSQWGYSYNGNLTGSATITYTDSNGPMVPHYQLRVIFWMILIDAWQGSDTIKVTLDGNQTLTQNRNNRLSN